MFVLDKSEAKEVKTLRCGLWPWAPGHGGGTYRYVARCWSEAHPDRSIGVGDQYDGMVICGEAADLLGEDPNEKPWN